MILNRRNLSELVRQANRITRRELVAKFESMQTRNLVVLRQAARDAGWLPQLDVDMIDFVATGVIVRRSHSYSHAGSPDACTTCIATL
jgi:hypothetical protein